MITWGFAGPVMKVLGHGALYDAADLMGDGQVRNA
jgi:hypothetical protein